MQPIWIHLEEITQTLISSWPENGDCPYFSPYTAGFSFGSLYILNCR